jgi:hypothetical protein
MCVGHIVQNINCYSDSFNLWVNNFTSNWNVLICATLTYVIHNLIQLINMMYITKCIKVCYFLCYHDILCNTEIDSISHFTS